MIMNWKKIGITAGAAVGVIALWSAAVAIFPAQAIPATIGGVVCGIGGFIGGYLWRDKNDGGEQ